MTAAVACASQVLFIDDTCTTRGANRELDAKDVFFLSRLNDPSTYFFHWLCKRYNLKLEEAMRTCPICLENVTHSIQLSCGHTFCRQCLKQAAEKEMTSCALCRKSHVLDPDALRAQFNATRLANMAWRLGERGYITKPPVWESGTTTPVSARSAASSGANGGGKSTTKAAASLGAESGESGFTKTGAAAVSCSKEKKDLLEALPHATRPQRATSSMSRWFEAETDCGAAPIGELSARWTGLLHRASSQGGEGVGALVKTALADRWRRHDVMKRESSQQQAGGDVGAASATELSSRWGRLMEACASQDCGEMNAADLASRWGLLSCHFQHPQQHDVGAQETVSTSRRWKGLVSPACLPKDVGGMDAASLSTVAGRRRRVAECGGDVGGMSLESINARAVVNSTLGRIGGADVGGKTGDELREAWMEMEGGRRGDDVGAESLRGLEDRWRRLVMMTTEVGCDVGARTLGEMRTAWTLPATASPISH